jgi:hypothetical protein
MAACACGGACAVVCAVVRGRAGCSSIFALLTENGPFRVEDDAFTLRKHLQSWNTVQSPHF